MKRLFIIMMAFVIAACTVSCSVSPAKSPVDAKEKVFTCEEMSITLTEGFAETAYEGYTSVYDSSEIAVFVLREGKEIFAADTSFDEYLGYVARANASRGASEFVTENGLTTFEYNYTNPDTGVKYRYLTAAFESEKAFWLVQFAAQTETYEGYKDTMIKWAKTVTFA